MTSAEKIYDSANHRRGLAQTLGSIWQNRDLIYLLTARDLTVRYKRSILGIWWTLLNPLLTTFVLYFVFSSVFKLRMPDGASFAPYLLSGVLLANFFNQGMTAAAESVSSGSGVLTKVSSRPELFAFSASLASAINFILGLIPLSLVSLISGSEISVRLPLTLAVVVSLTLLVTGLGLLISTVYVRFDDSRSIVALCLMMLTYLTPVFYPKSILGDTTRLVVNLNPLTSYLDCFRAVFNGGASVTSFDWIYMLVSGFLVFWIGVSVFARIWPRTVAML